MKSIFRSCKGWPVRRIQFAWLGPKVTEQSSELHVVPKLAGGQLAQTVHRL